MASKDLSGKDFEKFTFETLKIIMIRYPDAIVKMNDLIITEDGVRQVDITIRHVVAGIPSLIIVECKDYSRALNVTHVEAILAKMDAVGANAAIIVSRNGFSGGAVKRVRRHNVELCTWSNFLEKDISLIKRLYFLARIVYLDKILLQQAVRIGPVRLREALPSFPVLINGVPLPELIVGMIAQGIGRPPNLSDEEEEIFIINGINLVLSIKEYFGTEYHVFKFEDGSENVFANATLGISYREEWGLGRTQDLPTSRVLINVTRESGTFCFRMDEMVGSIEKMAKYGTFEELPDYAKNSKDYIVIVDMNMKTFGVAHRRGTGL